MPNVVSLKPSALNEATQKASIVTFHAPWCGHCKRLMPVLDRAAQNHEDVNFYKIDASKYGAELRADPGLQEVMSKVRGFPTVVHFDGNGGHEVHSGARSEEAIVGAHKRVLLSAGGPRKGGERGKKGREMTEKDVRSVQNGIVVFHATWCGYCKTFMPEFHDFAAKMAEEMPHISVGSIEESSTSKSLADKHGVKGFPTIRVIVNGESLPYSRRRSAEDLMEEARSSFGKTTVAEEEFMSEDMARSILGLNGGESRNPNVVSLKASALEDAMNKPAAVVMAHAPWCGYCKRFAPAFEKLSADFPHVTFGRINWDKHGNDVKGPVAGSVKSYPTILVAKDGNTFKFTGSRDDLPEYIAEWFPRD